MITYEQIPYQYGLCLKADCEKAAHCLRHLAWEVQPSHIVFAPVLLPHQYAPAGTACAHYRPDTRVVYARGFIRVLDNFPSKTLKAFRSHLISARSRITYFRMRRGEVPLSPDEQAFIVRVARKYGFAGDFAFDSYEERYQW